MVELFNPAGLRMLEDRDGAIAYGYLARRVLYARVVGRISAGLGERYVHALDRETRKGAPLAYFADESALQAADSLARSRFLAFASAEPRRFASIVRLSWRRRGAALARIPLGLVGEALELVDAPIEFERALCNATTFPDRRAKDFAHLWQLHGPRVFTRGGT